MLVSWCHTPPCVRTMQLLVKISKALVDKKCNKSCSLLQLQEIHDQCYQYCCKILWSSTLSPERGNSCLFVRLKRNSWWSNGNTFGPTEGDATGHKDLTETRDEQCLESFSRDSLKETPMEIQDIPHTYTNAALYSHKVHI